MSQQNAYQGTQGSNVGRQCLTTRPFIGFGLLLKIAIAFCDATRLQTML